LKKEQPGLVSLVLTWLWPLNGCLQLLTLTNIFFSPLHLLPLFLLNLPFWILSLFSCLIPQASLPCLAHWAKMAAPIPNMPLKCTICPKKPSFSDVSHLLTHVGSKGHLSHYYKTKIQGGSDARARALIDQYDQWYTDWGIDELMHERINLKDKKKPRPKPSGKFQALRTNTTLTYLVGRGLLNANQQSDLNRGRTSSLARSNSSYRPSPAGSNSAFNPRLGEPTIKQEEEHTPERFLPTFQSGQFSAPTRLSSLPLPRSRLVVQSRHSTPGIHPHYELSTYHYGDPTRQNNYRDPITTANHRQRSPCDDEDDLSTDNDLPGYNDSPFQNSHLGSGANGVNKDKTTPSLKGSVFPGMSLFDSATPKGRRRRNQKKSGRVLEQLEANSLASQAVEDVWTPNWSKKKSKAITGLPSSSSPLVSPRQPAVPSNRLPLARIDSRHSWLDQAGVSRYNSYTDQRLEEALKFGLHDPLVSKRKRPLEVYHDEDRSLTGNFSQSLQATMMDRKTSKRGRIEPLTAWSNSLREVDDEDEDDPDWEEVNSRKIRSTKRQSGRRESTPRQVNNGRHASRSRNDGIGRFQPPARPAYISVPNEQLDRRIELQDPFVFNASAHAHPYDPFYSQPVRPTPQLPSQRAGFPNIRRHGHSLSIEALTNGHMPTTGAFNQHLMPTHAHAQPFGGYIQGPHMAGMHPFSNLNHMAQPQLTPADWSAMLTAMPHAQVQQENWYAANQNYMNHHHANSNMENNYDSPPSVGNTPPTCRRRTRNSRRPQTAESIRAAGNSNHAEQLTQGLLALQNSRHGSVAGQENEEADEERTVTAPPSVERF
jgi:hypothetical protein